MIHGLAVDMSVPLASLSFQDWASQQVASALLLCGFFVLFAIPLFLKGTYYDCYSATQYSVFAKLYQKPIPGG